MIRRRTFLAGAAGLMYAATRGRAAEPPKDHCIETRFTYALAFSPDGKLLLTAGVGSPVATLWDVGTGEKVRTLEGHEGDLFAVAWSPDGRVAATAGEDRVIRLWDREEGRDEGTLKEHDGTIRSLAFSQDSTVLASGAEHTIHVWDVATRLQRASLTSRDFADTIAFSPDGKRLYAQGSNVVRVWDVAGSAVESHDLARRLLGFALSPDAGSVAVATGDSVRIVDTLTWQQTLAIDTNGSTSCVAYSTDGKAIAAEGPRHVIKIYDSKTGDTLAALEGENNGIESLAFSPDGRFLGSGGRQAPDFPTRHRIEATVVVWDLASRLK